MLSNQQKDFIKSNFGMPETDLAKISDKVVKIFNNFEKLSGYEIEAEAIESSYCSVGIKPGDKFVFSAMPIMLKTEKSTGGLCMRALGVLTPFLNTIVEKIIDGGDPNGSVWHVAECMDTGINNGGLGKVRFNFTAKKL